MIMEIDKIYNMDCLEGMRQIPDGSIDCCVTSPPYDNLRTYNGYCFDFENIAKELYRVTKQGGVVVWVVGDATIDGDETGSSFRQALYFKDIGFKLNDTMIWHKVNPCPSMAASRYTQAFEYMFVFSKGKPKTFNPIKVPCVHAGQNYTSTFRERGTDGNPDYDRKHKSIVIHDERMEYNVWRIGVQQEKFPHPAVFPEKIAAYHIRSWSNEGDIVLDPFMGSGTTAKVARALNRHYIGFEISAEYCEIIRKRLEQTKTLFDL